MTVYKFNIHHDSGIFDWYYSPESNILYNSNLEHINIGGFTYDKKKILHIRVSLGMNCNYKCGYCSEHPNKCNKTKQHHDYVKMVTALKDLVDAKFNMYDECTFSLWGGEPLLYMKDIKALVPIIKDVFGDHTEFGLSTNGELLNCDNYDYLISNKIKAQVSYDGPGQFVRNINDIFKKGTMQHDVVCDAMKNHQWTISPVFHKHNPSVYNYVTYIQSLFGNDTRIGDMSVMRVYDENSLKYTLNEKQLSDMFLDIVKVMNNPELKDIISRPISNAFFSFYINYGKEPLRKTACFIGKDYLTIDMSGNIWTCHNNVGQLTDEAGDVYKLGSIYDKTYTYPKFTKLLQKTSTKCQDCLQLRLCRGGCAMSPTIYDNENCIAYYYEKLMQWQMIINQLTGGGIITNITKES